MLDILLPRLYRLIVYQQLTQKKVDHQALVLDPKLHPQAFHLLYYLVAQLN